MTNTMLILMYVAIALVCSRIPYLRVYFSLCNTLLQQVVCVCLEGGITNKIKLHKDGSSETTNNVNSPFKKALIAYAGYTGTLIAAIGLFYFVSKGNYHIIIYLVSGLVGISLLLWIRSLFGLIWGLSFLCVLAVPIYFKYEAIVVHISIFLASVMFIQSLMNALQVCKQSFLSRENPARKAAIVQTKFFPAMILGFVLLGQSLYAGYFIFKNFLS
ncbi:MAG TPA: M50 family metallopeptidase [Neobacillus sp.]